MNSAEQQSSRHSWHIPAVIALLFGLAVGSIWSPRSGEAPPASAGKTTEKIGGEEKATAGEGTSPATKPTLGPALQGATETKLGLPFGYAKTEAGAGAFAANFAAIGMGLSNLGDKKMLEAFDPNGLVDVPNDSARAACSAGWCSQVTRALGTNVKDWDKDAGTATVDVWIVTVAGRPVEGKQRVPALWQTLTFQIEWQDEDWVALTATSKLGPAPEAPAASNTVATEVVREWLERSPW